jgi:hypothetical protein
LLKKACHRSSWFSCRPPFAFEFVLSESGHAKDLRSFAGETQTDTFVEPLATDMFTTIRDT